MFGRAVDPSHTPQRHAEVWLMGFNPTGLSKSQYQIRALVKVAN